MDEPLLFPSYGSTSHILEVPSIPIGSIKFVGQDRPGDPAMFCVVDKDCSAPSFATDQFLERFKLPKLEVMISITGSGFYFPMRSSKLEQIFKGLLRAAKTTNAWIVTGGSDSGVMKRVGEANRDTGQCALVPCIGIATFSKVTNNQLLDPTKSHPIDYVSDKSNNEDSAALNPDHTHFILVNSSTDEWGEEISFRTEFEDHIGKIMKVPYVLVAINGGLGTVEAVFEGVYRKSQIIIVEGSGRASDAIAALVKNCRDPKRYNLDVWNEFITDALPLMRLDKQREFDKQLENMRQNNKYITIFNPDENETEDIQKAIMHSIYACYARPL